MRPRLSTRTGLLAAALALGGLSAHSAHADRQEWHLSPVGILGAAHARDQGRSAWALAGGAGLRAAYGITNWFELGLAADFALAQNLRFADVTMAGQPGNLYVNLYTVGFGLDARLIGELMLSRHFARIHPFIGIRGGGLLRILTAQELLDDQRELILRPSDTTTLTPAVVAYAGAEFRFSRAWLVGLAGNFTYASANYYSAGGALELSFMTY
jgi:hypothetical protein